MVDFRITKKRNQNYIQDPLIQNINDVRSYSAKRLRNMSGAPD